MAALVVVTMAVPMVSSAAKGHCGGGGGGVLGEEAQGGLEAYVRERMMGIKNKGEELVLLVVVVVARLVVLVVQRMLLARRKGQVVVVWAVAAVLVVLAILMPCTGRLRQESGPGSLPRMLLPRLALLLQ